MEFKKGNNMFYIGEGGETLAQIDFVSNEENDIVIEHTIVSETLKGQGIGVKLVKKVVDYAREKNKKIIPHCPYAKKVLEATKEYEDVLKRL